jgi:hypothetical protein
MFDRLVCLVRRQHDYHLSEGGGRVYLHCRRCGVRTPGWETSPRVRVLPAQAPVLRLLLDDAELPIAHGPFRLLLADAEPRMPALLSLRLQLADAGFAPSDILPLDEIDCPSEATLSVGFYSSTGDARLGLE